MRMRVARASGVPFAAICSIGALLLVPSTVSASTSPQEHQPSAPTPSADSPPALGSSQTNDEIDDLPDATAEIVGLDGSKTSGFASLTVRITNNGTTEDIHYAQFENPTYIYREAVFSGISLIDGNDTRHHPVMDEHDYCLCSGYAPRLPFAAFVRPDESVDYWAMYYLPENTKSVDVKIPGFDPIEDVPVG
ncbi:hypothetical protein [Streptomonospora wellingtoniae]|uniref:DUF4352 domain-containing protein n=1 Tax=Streptomonospora wellingtoniae TaxID=3075544 RepID=A0ABU2KXT7_9ACTN|nr:hypothetical protein [Streptomonospora sp. DSM 45055]MDT0304114.1 hypothetical protein [Streptomonospora sp. DSM 45055]